jgi:hypothetical protein
MRLPCPWQATNAIRGTAISDRSHLARIERFDAQTARHDFPGNKHGDDIQGIHRRQRGVAAGIVLVAGDRNLSEGMRAAQPTIPDLADDTSGAALDSIHSRSVWASYETARPGSLRLMFSDARLKDLRADDRDAFLTRCRQPNI